MVMTRRSDVRLAVATVPGDDRAIALRSVDAQRAALGAALAARRGDVLAACQQAYCDAYPDAYPDDDPERVRADPLWEIHGLAVSAIARCLQTGQAADAGVRSEIASLGRSAVHRNHAADFVEQPASPGPEIGSAPSRPPAGPDQVPGHTAHQLSVALLTKLNFWWSDATCDVLAEEGCRLGIDAAVVGEAAAMVERSSRASLVDMAARYDAEISVLQDHLAHQARHDPLTGLANRAALLDRLERALARLARRPDGLAVVFVDVDNFKAVNDVLGHGVGDAVLRETAARLIADVRPEDLVARIGGDEFVVLFEDLAEPATDGARLGERLRARVGAPMRVGDDELALTISAGVAAVRGAGLTTEEVLTEADAAMYRVKRSGRNRVAVVELGGGAGPVRFAVASGLHAALEQGELRVVYQPLWDARTGGVTGFEALLRWEHPERGTIMPREFVPVAEESGLIWLIGAWVLREACRQSVAWAGTSPAGPRIAVNVSGRQLAEPAFVDEVAGALAASGLPACRLVLEVSESVLLVAQEASRQVCSALVDLGVHVSIDDFGTGYTSLTHLQRLPVDQVKIDREFIRELAGQGDTRVMGAVVALAHELGIEVAAEGVETEAELATVRALGCDVLQGYLLGRPVPPAELDGRAGTPRLALRRRV